MAFDVEFTTHTVNQHVEVELAHTGNNGLAGFFIGVHAEGRIFLSQAAEGESHLFLVGLGLRLNGLRNNRIREFHLFKDHRVLGVAQRVARGHGLQADGSSNIACLNLLDFVTLVGVHLQQTAETFLLVLRGVQHGFAGNHNAGVHADEGELTNERVAS